jgi:hypothetical protein
MKGGTGSKGDSTPQTLGQLIRKLLKQIVTGMLKSVPKSLAVAAVVTVINTYLLVFVNEGFSGGDPLLGMILVLQGNELAGALFWLLLGTLGVAAVHQLREKRLGATLGSVGQVPALFRGSFDASQPITLSVLLFGAAFMVAVMSWLGNLLIGVELAIVFLGAMITKGESLTALAFRLGYSDFQQSRGRKPAEAPFNPSWTGVAIAGFLGGMVLALLLHPGLVIGLVLGGVLAVIGYFLIGRNTGPRPVAPLLLFCALVIAAMVVVPVLADDGGWQESGGTVQGWVQSEGAVRAVVNSAVAGGATAAGVALGTSLATAGAGVQGSMGGGGSSGGTTGRGDVDEYGRGPEYWEEQRRRDEEERRKRLQQMHEGLVYDPDTDSWVEPKVLEERQRKKQEEERKRKRQEDFDDGGRDRLIERNLDQLRNVTDPKQRQWFEDYIKKHSGNPDELVRATKSVQAVLSETRSDQEGSESEWQGGLEGAAASVRDNALRINRAAAHFVPGGDRIVNLQQAIYGGIEDYEKGGLKGAVKGAVVNALDNYTAGAASAAANAENVGDFAKRMTDQVNVLDSAGSAMKAIKEGDVGGALDAGLDTVERTKAARDAARGARDLVTGGETPPEKGKPGKKEDGGESGGTDGGDKPGPEGKKRKKPTGEDEDTRRKKADEDARKKAEEDEAWKKKKAEEEARKKAEEDEAWKKKKAEEEARKKAEEDEAWNQKEEAEKARKKADYEAAQKQQKAELEADRKKAQEEVTQKRTAEQEAARKKAEGEVARKTPGQIAKDCHEQLDTINPGLEGEHMIDPSTGKPRPHLWDDPIHRDKFLAATGNPNFVNDVAALSHDAQSEAYNKLIVQQAREAIGKPDTVMYHCDYHNLKGENLGPQVNVEFTGGDKKTRVIVGFKNTEGQLKNAMDIEKSGTITERGFEIPHPQNVMRNYRPISNHTQAQWLESRGETPLPDPPPSGDPPDPTIVKEKKG